MPDIVLISGSPSRSSRSTALLKLLEARFLKNGYTTAFISVPDFPAEDLIGGRYDSEAFKPAVEQIAQARAIVVGTPVYKAAYCGTLKTFLDILPQTALQGKVVLPIVTGGSPSHLLAIDYALKPVLSALGATELLQGIYAVDDQVKVAATGEVSLHDDINRRMETSGSLVMAAFKSFLAAPK